MPRLLRIAQQVDYLPREFSGLIGQRADFAVAIRQAFGAQPRGYHRDSRREGFQQFDAHAGAAQDRADEQRVARQGIAHIFDESDQLDASACRNELRGGGSEPTTITRARGSSASTSGKHLLAQTK